MAKAEFFDDQGCIRTPKHDVWLVASNLLDGAMSPKYVYQVFREGRWGIVGSVRADTGIFEKLSMQLSNGEDTSESEYEDDTNQRRKKQTTVLPRATFQINIPPAKWIELAPTEKLEKRADRTSGQRRKLKMPAGQWTNDLQDLIWDQHHIPCALTFNNQQVALEPTLAKHYVSFTVTCNECKNEGKGYILNTPMPGETVVLFIEMQDTRGVRHDRKRQCHSSERDRVGKAIMQCGSASVFRRQEAGKKMKEPGSQEPPTLYPPTVLAKAKEEANDRILNIPKSKNAMDALEEMKYTAEFAGTIHRIGRDPVEVRYDTPGQMLLYRTVRGSHYVRFQVDATAQLVARLTRPNGHSGHIFLFQLVAQTVDQTFPVAQLLSEAQDTNSIATWLIDLTRRGAKDPNEGICDNSGALLGALCRAYARVFDTKTYKEMCFLFLTKQSNILPRCFIRLDINHLMSWAGKWKVWNKIPNKMIKDHYMRFLGLAVKCKTLEEERSCLLKILTLSCATTYGDSDDGEKVAAQLAVDDLLNAVRGREDLESHVEQEQLAEEQLQCDEELADDDGNGDPENVAAWAKQLAAEAKELASQEGSSINPYFSEEVYTKFLDLSKTCMLWSSVMVNPFKSPFERATTAYLEGDFHDLKHRVLKKETRPMKINKMVAQHIRSIHGKNLITSAQVIESAGTNSSSQRQEDNGDLDKVENWRGLGSKSSSRKKNYLNPTPAVEQAATAKQNQKPVDLLLKNGSSSGPAETAPGTFVIVRNTCAFDSLMQLLALAIQEYDNFRDEVLALQGLCPGLEVAMSLATVGATPQTYALRAATLAAQLDLQDSEEVPKRTRSRKDTQEKTTIAQYELPRHDGKRKRGEDSEGGDLQLKFDSYGNLYNLANNTLPVFPSLVHAWTCSQGHKASKAYTFASPHFDILVQKGIGSLQESVNFGLATEQRNCNKRSCTLEMAVEVKSMGHLLIDLECLKTKQKSYDLQDIPEEIEITDKTYSLVGCVAYSPGHYVAYGRRRGTNRWELMDDCRTKICNPGRGKKNIHLILYIHRVC